MNLESIKYVASVFLLSSFFYTSNVVYAEFLIFKAGDKASYTISQKTTGERKLFDETILADSQATIDVNIEVLSSNEQSSYPFDVVVTLKKIFFTEVQQNGESSTTISYDSSGLKTVENHILAKHIDQLIDHPLHFRVEKDFNIKEVTGYLAQIDESYDSPSLVGIFGTTPWSFELLLTQLFHLSGENLKATNSYSASCYQFLNWEDEALNDQELNLDQSSSYIISNADANHISASWQGNAKVVSFEGRIKGNVSVAGNVTWDTNNPMIQTRELKAQILETHSRFPLHAKISAEQTWHSKPFQ